MNGQVPFEGDTYIPQEILKLKEKFSLRAVIETGAQYGATLGWFTKHFDAAIGCEPNEEFYKIAEAKGLTVANMNSEDFLMGFDHDGEERVLFYIDSHWHGTPCPLKRELEIIAIEFEEPVIVIHDFKVPDHPEMGFDSYDFDLEFSEIEPLLNKIYKNGFDYHYPTVCNGANRGIIYIYPKA